MSGGRHARVHPGELKCALSKETYIHILLRGVDLYGFREIKQVDGVVHALALHK